MKNLHVAIYTSALLGVLGCGQIQDNSKSTTLPGSFALYSLKEIFVMWLEGNVVKMVRATE